MREAAVQMPPLQQQSAKKMNFFVIGQNCLLSNYPLTLPSLIPDAVTTIEFRILGEIVAFVLYEILYEIDHLNPRWRELCWPMMLDPFLLRLAVLWDSGWAYPLWASLTS